MTNVAFDPVTKTEGLPRPNSPKTFTSTRPSLTGVSYCNLTVYGFGSATDYQKTFANLPLTLCNEVSNTLSRVLGRRRFRKSRIDILREFEGLIPNGEMLLVLGRPGSGCSTLLKTLAGQTQGLNIQEGARINYQGLRPETIQTNYRGEFVYQSEADIHFPHLTVGQTLEFATKARPQSSSALSEAETTEDIGNKIVRALGLSPTLKTKIGNEFVVGVSGGERKRVSLAEVMVGCAPFTCWDNCTRGLDSATALDFVKTLRLSTTTTGSISIATLYQASDDIYNVFDKLSLLYDGRQIFFGSTSAAKAYFVKLGFVCSPRSTTADFLTSLTNPAERTIHLEYESRVPRTPDEFLDCWKQSIERMELVKEIENFEKGSSLGKNSARGLHQINEERSPYSISFLDQVKMCTVRGVQRMANDLAPPISSITGNAVVAIIIGSLFYNLPNDTNSFFGRGVLLFFTILTNAFLGAFEGVALWSQRPIVQKHYQYAFYHPSAEAIASMICDLPNKIILTFFFNFPLYFLANLRRTPEAFFTFCLFAFVSLLTGSVIFRTIGALSSTLTASIAPGAVFIYLMIIYTGFAIPVPYMHPWLRWFGYLNPISYAFESLMVNEFHGRQFSCARFTPEGPGYENVEPQARVCNAVGADAGASVVDGDKYIAIAFEYYSGNLWRNLGIIIVIMLFFCGLYLLATEHVLGDSSKGEVLLFRRGKSRQLIATHDEESNHRYNPRVTSAAAPEKGGLIPAEADPATFVWNSLSYEVKTKHGLLKILDDVEGWIKPGTLTALMGASGAGKTTLLNVLANRVLIGVVSGETIIDANHRGEGFARKVGYAQQQDLHLPTATVREALCFTALLRQPQRYSRAEKEAYVDEVIDTLDMTAFADAVIGVPGQGLNIEQRKRVTIGIELAARPELLLFLDEPTSGLDSNTAWSICTLLRKLADKGQPILCTIHQPSGTLFQMFDRLLFLVNGKSAYFGEIGPNAKTLTDYFGRLGARSCGTNENPAEWLLDITGGAPQSTNQIDWPANWASSVERQNIKTNIETLKTALRHSTGSGEKSSSSAFAVPFLQQLHMVTKRNIESDWRTPAYLYSKTFLTLGIGLVNGFSFYNSPPTIQGIQNQLFSVYLLSMLFSNVVQLIMPRFLENRALYEVRERPSRTYSWTVFILSNIISEIPTQSVMAVLLFITWYFPLGMYRHTAIQTRDAVGRGALMFGLLWCYNLFCSTFSQMLATIMPDAATGVNVASLLYSLSLIFCGVLVPYGSIPTFWRFMYRVSPVTYSVSAILATGISAIPIDCSPSELLVFRPPARQSCGQYLAAYVASTGAYVLNPNAMDRCSLCPVRSTDQVLLQLGINVDDRWWMFGVGWVFVVVNVLGALGLYRLVRYRSEGRGLRDGGGKDG